HVFQQLPRRVTDVRRALVDPVQREVRDDPIEGRIRVAAAQQGEQLFTKRAVVWHGSTPFPRRTELTRELDARRPLRSVTLLCEAAPSHCPARRGAKRR